MANLTITAASVGVASGTVDVQAVQVGESVTHGQPLYFSANKYYKCDATSATKANCAVISLGAASTDGWVMALFPGGEYTVGATLTLATTYVISATSGAIAPIADLASTNYSTILGTAKNTSTIVFQPYVSGVAKP